MKNKKQHKKQPANLLIILMIFVVLVFIISILFYGVNVSNNLYSKDGSETPPLPPTEIDSCTSGGTSGNCPLICNGVPGSDCPPPTPSP